MAVNVAKDAPAVRGEARRRIVGEPSLDGAVDRYAVVIVNDDQFLQPEDASKRGSLVREAFHQAAVAYKSVRAVVDDGVTGAIELRGQQLLRQRHADRVG